MSLKDPFRVSSSSTPHSVAAAIVNAIHTGDETVAVRAIGAAAVNTAVKATAIARNELLPNIDLYVVPTFANTIGKDGDEISVLILTVGLFEDS